MEFNFLRAFPGCSKILEWCKLQPAARSLCQAPPEPRGCSAKAQPMSWPSQPMDLRDVEQAGTGIYGTKTFLCHSLNADSRHLDCIL